MPIIKTTFALFFIASSLVLSGCSSKALLPKHENKTESPWGNFQEAKAAFDKVIPNQTTLLELKSLGFDPEKTPNINRITYLEVIQHFMPNQSIRPEDLDPSVRACLEARKDCFAYEIEPGILESERYGNVALDVLNFDRKTKRYGWKFIALIVVKEELVVYKLWGGQPNVLTYERQRNPLGPFQNLGGVLDAVK